MKIEPRHLVLWVIDELGERPNGKTYLQKMCFFVGQVLGLDLGYRAHYYGPYSDLVSAEIAFLNANGYVFESRKHSGMADARGWEVTRFDYQLSDRGSEGVSWLNSRYPVEGQRVRDAVRRVLTAGDLGYVGLSFAAKTYWILKHEGQAMTFDRVGEKAKQFRWSVEVDDVRKAADFLEHLSLVRAAAS
jgi:hypothetical protein